MENQELYEVTNAEQKPVEKIKITFSRKLARPFTTKAGKEYVAISIPNENSEDKSPWWEFVLPIHMVHSDHYGSKALWAEIPADGSTALTRSLKPSGADGTWSKEEKTVDNKSLKAMVEAYKLKPKTQGAR